MIDTPLENAVALVPAAGNRRILGLAGPPGAGKSQLARHLVDGVNARLGARTAAYMPLDGFHLSNAQLERLGYADRKGAPFTFDVDGYIATLRRVLEAVSRPVYVPDYDRLLHEPVAARHVIEPRVRLVITEGNYVASREPGWREVAELATELWYVDAPDGVREDRLVDRHARHGSATGAARRRVERNDRANAEFVAGTRGDCARVVPLH